MKELEIYFRDLKPEVQKAALEIFEISSPQDANWDCFPLFTLVEDSKLEEDRSDG